MPSSNPLPRKSWRDKMKAKDPGKYEKVLTYSRIYSSLYRCEAYTAEQMATKRNMTDEERENVEKLLERKKRLNESARERMRKMRQKRKLKEQKEGKEKTKPQTRQQREKHERQKQIWRDRKKAQRETMTKQEHERMLANRRAKYALKRERERLHDEEHFRLKAEKEKLDHEKKRLQELERQLNQKQEEIDKKKKELAGKGEDVRSKVARRKSLERARKGMPKKASHYASTVMDLINQASPEKNKRLKTIQGKEEKLKDTVMNVVASELSQPSSSIKKTLASSLSGQLRKEKLQRQAAKKFRVSRKLVSRAKRLQAGRKSLSMKTLKLVRDFYQSNSYTIPDKKYVSKRTGQPTSLLDRSLTWLYSQFIKAHPHVSICFAKFCQLRPRNIKTMGKAKLAGCLCEYCANLKLKLDTINSHLASKQATTIPDVYSLSSITLCDKEPGSKYHLPSCVQRECIDCGVDKLDEILEPLMTTPQQSVSWKRWELVSEEVKTRKGPSTVKKRGLVTKTGTVDMLIRELKDEMRTFSEHLFIKDFQAHQLQALRHNIPDDSALSILDFAENYVCRYQDEAQSAYWSQQSATIHPFVTYYRCHCRDTITESIVVISDDLSHDYHAVHQFQKVVIEHLLSKRKLSLRKYFRFSDCCANQYRSKGPFSDIGNAIADFNLQIEHNYCGERHGKGASDGESAVIKSSASTAVKNRRSIIRNARELYNFAKDNLTVDVSTDNLCTHFRRTVLYVPSSSVNRERQRTCKPIPGTRKVHCIKTVRDGVVATRNLSCCCSGCIDGKGTCINKLYVHHWKEVALHPTKEPASQQETETSPSSVADNQNVVDGGESHETEPASTFETEVCPSSVADIQNVVDADEFHETEPPSTLETEVCSSSVADIQNVVDAGESHETEPASTLETEVCPSSVADIQNVVDADEFHETEPPSTLETEVCSSSVADIQKVIDAGESHETESASTLETELHVSPLSTADSQNGKDGGESHETESASTLETELHVSPLSTADSQNGKDGGESHETEPASTLETELHVHVSPSSTADSQNGKDGGKSRATDQVLTHEKERSLSFGVEDFVVVKLVGKKGRREWYLAKVLQIHEDTAQLKYLHQSGPYFTWPAADDVSWQSKEDVISTVNPRVACFGSRAKVTLSKEDFEKIGKLFGDMKEP